MRRFIRPVVTLAVAAVILSACAVTSVCGEDTHYSGSQAGGNQGEAEKIAKAHELVYEGKYPEAMAILEDILSRHPDSREALFLLATAYEWQDMLEEAERVYTTIVSIDEDNLEAWGHVAKLQAWRGKYDDAIALYGKLISRFGDTPYLLVGLARTLSWANRLDEAVLYYERVLLQDSENLEALAGKAQVLRWMGELRQARAVIRKAQETGPDHPDVVREARQIELGLSPRVTVSYSESLEKDYLRATDSYYYNLGNSTWRAEADFFLTNIQELSFDIWSSRDWEVDKNLGAENFRVASTGFSASASVPVGHSVSIGGTLSIRAYERYRENVLYALMADEVREENYEVWAALVHNAWDLRASVWTVPFFEKSDRELPPLKKLEIGEQTAGRFEVGRRFSRTVRAHVGCEVGSYSDANDRTRVYAGVEGSPSHVGWVSMRYAVYYQDFDAASRNYFAPLDEFNHQAGLVFKLARPASFVAAGLTLGQSHSSNFGDIFWGGLSGVASKNITERWRVFVSGLTSYDDNKYSVGSFSLGFELIL